jgi:Tol biopolymer transport system component
LITGLTQQPEVSPDGKLLAYALYKQSNMGTTAFIHVADIETGKPIPFEVKAEHGRCRWMPDGKAIAYIDLNESGQLGVFVQDFVPGKDTSSTRRAIAGFDPDKETETFGISPDGSSITISEVELLTSLVRIENVPDL